LSNIASLTRALSAISMISCVGRGEGERAVTKRGAVLRNVSLNTSGIDEGGSIVRACTRDELSNRGLRGLGLRKWNEG
jgi:hypothetical protein